MKKDGVEYSRVGEYVVEYKLRKFGRIYTEFNYLKD